jgi:uncharacterized LabA/DUF88 family protein
MKGINMEFSKFCDLAKRYPDERVQVFIDQSNVYKVIETEYNGRAVDPTKLAQLLVSGRKLIRINIYLSLLNRDYGEEQADRQKKFVFALESIPFVTVRTRPLNYSGDGKMRWEKGIDVLLATDMLSQAYGNGYDTLVLISGDGDYAPVLEEIRRFGKQVENAFPKRYRSDALRGVSDVFVDLDEALLEKCFRKRLPYNT